MIVLATLLVAAYLVGSIPTGVLLARWKGVADPRSGGSGNIGATNVARTLGKKLGALTLLGDAAKGAVPVVVARSQGVEDVALSAVGVAAVVGHMAPVFLGFKGGKGVATGFGVYLALAPQLAGVAIAVFAATFAATRIVSLASLGAAASVPLVAAAYAPLRWMAPAGLVLGVLVVYKHRENLRRLLHGEEPTFRLGSSAG